MSVLLPGAPRWLWPGQTRMTLGGQKTWPQRMVQQRTCSHISHGTRGTSPAAPRCGVLQAWDNFVGLQMAPATHPKFIPPQRHGELICLDTQVHGLGNVVAQGLSLHPIHEPLVSHRAVHLVQGNHSITAHGQAGDTSVPFASPTHSRVSRQPLKQDGKAR